MRRPFIFVAAAMVVAVAGSATTFLLVAEREPNKPVMSDEQLAVRESFFGVSKETPPIKEGQEMRPRW